MSVDRGAILVRQAKSQREREYEEELPQRATTGAVVAAAAEIDLE